MTTKTQGEHTPGPDARGNYWFECGCMVNRIMSKRCPLHAAAPALLEACEVLQEAVEELLSEFVSKKRAADWGIINDAGVKASRAIRAASEGA